MYSTKAAARILKNTSHPAQSMEKGMSPERSPLVSLSDIHGTAVIVKG